MGERLQAAEGMPCVGVLGDQAQGDLLAAAADEDGNIAHRWWVELAQPVLDDRERGFEIVETAHLGAELVSVFVVVLLEPARADAEDEAPVRDVVDRPRHVGQQVRVAVGVAADQRPELDALGLLRPGAEHRPALEVLAGARVGVAAIQREEVVPVIYDVCAHLLGAHHGVADVAVVGELGVQLDGNSGHGRSLGGRERPYPRRVTSPTMTITTRPITEDEVLGFREKLVKGFGEDLDDKDRDPERFLALIPLDRTVAAFDGGEIVGTLGTHPLRVTVPGGASIPMAGTTMVTVQNTHRRQGVLRAMMRDHLDDAAAREEALAGLWASETPIYGRFGFGHATSREVVEAAKGTLSISTSGEGVVRTIEPDRVAKLLPAIYDDVLAHRPGMLSRSDHWWKYQVVKDPEHWREGDTAKRFVVYEVGNQIEGYAIYRQKSDWGDLVPNGQVKVIEALAISDRAHSGLWNYLGNVDLFPRLRFWNLPADDPLWWKLAEPRRVQRKRSDGLWVRIMDVPGALGARTYESDGSIRIGVDDQFRPDTSGVYELAVSDGEGKIVEVDDEAEVELGIDALGALYLGGSNALSMAAAGLIDGLPEQISTLHRLFHTDAEPWCDSIF